MTEDQRKKKAVQALQALLELDGLKTTIKDVSERVGDDFSDLIKEKDRIANDMRSEIVQEEKSDRKKVIGDLIVNNWSLIKDIEEVKATLLNGYCLGRYSREKREEMKRELIEKATGSEVLDTIKTGTAESKEYTF